MKFPSDMFNIDCWYNAYTRIMPAKSLTITTKRLRHKDKYHVFIAVKNINWEETGLVSTWRSLINCEVTSFDWGERYDQYADDWHASGKYLFNQELCDKVQEVHSKHPIDIFFSYLSGRWVFPKTIKEICSMGIFTINIGFDDTRSFWGVKESTGYSGNAEIAPAYDLCITCQNESDAKKYKIAGAQALFLPPGGNSVFYASLEPKSEKKIPVSFVGQNYGERERLITYLADHGIPVHVRGMGWENDVVSQEEMLQIYSNSLVTLGFGYIGDGTKFTGLKGRDFEVPLTGTAYLTSYNGKLAECFKEDEEILFYRDKKEMLRKIKHCLKNPEKAIEIGLAGRKRALRDHTWDKRWQQILRLCDEYSLP